MAIYSFSTAGRRNMACQPFGAETSLTVMNERCVILSPENEGMKARVSPSRNVMLVVTLLLTIFGGPSSRQAGSRFFI
jgi:hypothetical protein